MQEPVCYEQYPGGIVLVSGLVSLLIYAIGIYILLQFGIFAAICYLAFIIILEARLIGGHCRDCYYYGRTCAFGRGRVSALFVQRGRSERFAQNEVTWKDIIPDFLVFIIPLLAGIILLVQAFTWSMLILVTAIFLLGFVGNALVRGQLACRHCRQRELGCPAVRLFDRSGKP